MPTYLTMPDAAAAVATSPATIRYWISTGKLRAFKPGKRVLVRLDDLQALVEGSAVADLRAAKAKAARPRKAVHP